jgi:hypothetical protein
MCVKTTKGKDGKLYYSVDSIRINKKKAEELIENQKRAKELWKIVSRK